MGIKLTGARELQRKLKAKQRAMERETAGALGEAATELERDIKSRVFPAKRVSRQDAPGGSTISLSGRSPVRTKIQKAQRTAIVSVQRHWTTARSAAVRNTLPARDLQRKGLYIAPRFEFVRFSQDPGLAAWAKRPEKGTQFLRHVVRLSKPEHVRALSITPGAREAFPQIHRIWLRATRRAYRS